VLPDFQPSDVCGSCFAIRDYRVHQDFGGDPALARLRERMRARGLRLMLDFVPNHMAPDHDWVQAHPEWFVAGDAISDEQGAIATPSRPHYLNSHNACVAI
jgi:glycosidase